jgi:hypothetical protein
MGGLLSSSRNTSVIPLQPVPDVNVAELERLSKTIEETIARCSADRALLLRSKYTDDPASVNLDSCVVTLPFYGNHTQTFQLLKTRFQSKAKAIELSTKEYPDQDDDNYGCSTVFFFERSTIKVIV